MRKITFLDSFENKKTTFDEAKMSFIKHSKLKNLAPRTIGFYEETLDSFHKNVNVTYLSEITQEMFDDFVFNELERGKKTTSLNSVLRGLRVFFKYCAEQEYIKPLNIKLLKEDQDIKEPYTDAELRKLLTRPESSKWVEYRTWAMINYLIATGNRARTVVNLKIEDINFDEMTIHLRAVKNRRQQIIPLSPALKTVFLDYLSSWKWYPEDYLFPSVEGNQLAITTFQQNVRRYNVSRGVTKTSLHLFRHTFAKNFILSGGGMIQLQTILGHSSMEMTRHYVNLYGTDLRKNFEFLNLLDNIKRNQ